jgi:mRNA interferase RelE/StbE
VNYRVVVRPAARRQLRALAPDIRRRLAPSIEALAANPRPRGVRQLAGRLSLYRLRVGDYRILYTVDDAESVVTVAMIGHRRDVYR